MILVHVCTLAAWFGGPHRMHCFSAGRRLPRSTPLTQGERSERSSGTMRPAAFGPKGSFLWLGGQEGGHGGCLSRAPREGGRRLRGKQQAGKVRPGSCGLSGAPARASLGCIISCHGSVSLRQASRVQTEHSTVTSL